MRPDREDRNGLPAEIGTTVVGGGIVGLCIAAFLAAEGADVALIDDGRPGGADTNAGSLHVQMQSRFMRMYPELVEGLEKSLHLYPRAVRAWQELQQEIGADFELKNSGGIMIAESADQFDFLAKKCRRERELGLDVTMLDRNELMKIAPYLGPSIVGAELCANEGKLNPLLATTAIRQWGKRKGVNHVTGTHVEQVRRLPTGFEAVTGRGNLRTGRLVLAAGAGTNRLAADLDVNVPAHAEPLHVNITEPTAPMVKHLVQHADRQITFKQMDSGHIVIGGGWPAKPAGQRQVPMIHLASLIANATLGQQIAPQIAPLRIVRTWAGLNTTTDGSNVMGEVSSVPGLFVAVPGDAGFTLGPLLARQLTAVMLGRKADEDLSFYSPDRFITATRLMPAVAG